MKHAAFPFRRPQCDAMTTSSSLLCLLIVTFCLSLAQPSVAVAQTNTPAPLPSAAQEALNKGILAAKVPDYLLAIRFFEEARKLAPAAPVIYLNMGLAESRVPGRELRAMAWFGAYLAAYPNAPNAAAVKEQIAVLEVRNQSNVSRLIKSVQDAANLSGDNGTNLTDVAALWVKTGDIAAAVIAERDAQIANLRQAVGRENPAASVLTAEVLGDPIVDSAKRAIARVQAEEGDVVGALKTADLVKDAYDKSRAQGGVATVQARRGDIAGAQKTTDLIQAANVKSSAQCEIAEAQIKAGDISGAKTTLASAQKTADLIEDRNWKGFEQESIANIQVKVGIANASISSRESTSSTTAPILPVTTASDWLKKLDDDNKSNDCPLSTGHFLDLAGYLKSLPRSDDSQEVFKSLHGTAKKIVQAQSIVSGMLKQQVER